MTEVTITTLFKKSLLSAKLGEKRKINHTTFRKLLLKLSHIYKKLYTRASLVVQWLRIRLPMQGTRVRALVWEDPTCRRTTGPVNHNY